MARKILHNKSYVYHLLLFSLFLLATKANAQIGIGTTSPDSSSVIDLRSTTRGILIPRMASVQRLAINLPAKGLMVFDNDSSYFFYYDGAIWRSLKNFTQSSVTAGPGVYISGTGVISVQMGTAEWNANKLQSYLISPKTPTNNQVLKWNSGLNEWTPATDTGGGGYSAGAGMSLNGNIFSAQNTIAQWNANEIEGTNIANTAPIGGQVLQYNSTTSKWTPATISTGTNYTSGSGISISGTTISANNTTATWNANQVQGNNISPKAPINNQVMKWNSGLGEWTPATDTTTTYTGSTGITITGTSIAAQNTTAQWNASQIEGTNISTTTPASGQVLQYNSTSGKWVPATISTGTTYTGGAGITISGTTIIADSTDASWNANKIQSKKISPVAPSNNQVLKWNSGLSEWTPATDTSASYTAGTGISISGSTINSNWTTSGTGIYNNNTGNVGIGTSSPNSTALLDLTSTTQGFLAPRMTTTQRKAITSPATGLIVFDNTTDSIYVYNGTKWANFSVSNGSTPGSGTNWSISGNSGTGSSNYIGTSDNNAFNIKENATQVANFQGNSIAFGNGSNINNATNCYAIGSGTSIGYNKKYSFAIGDGSSISNDSGFAFGDNAAVNGYNSFAIGNNSASNGNAGLAIGSKASVGYNVNGALALGQSAAASGDSGYAIGNNAQANVRNSLAIGSGAAANSVNSFAIGKNSTVGWSITDGIALGDNADATSNNSIAIGSSASSSAKTQGNGTNAIAIGTTAVANSASSIAIGRKANVGYSLTTSMAIGDSATNNASTSVAIGADANIGYNSEDIALGVGASVSGTNSAAIGYNAKVTTNNAIVLGSGANVGVGTSAPASTALLDLTSTTQGLLAPRMTTTQRTAISSPATGLVVYDNTLNSLYLYNGTAWAAFSTGGAAASQWTTSGSNIYNANTANVGIGKTSPSYQLDIKGPVNADSLMLGGYTIISSKGTSNLLMGVKAGAENSGTGNVFIGGSNGIDNTANNNMFIGNSAGYSNTSGSGNQFEGYFTGYYNTTGASNCFSGQQAGYNNTTGSYNVFNGDNAGMKNTTGSNNSFLGMQAGYNNTTGSRNTVQGYTAYYTNTAGSQNEVSGYQAGYSGASYSYNVIHGYQAGYNTNANYNTFVGYNSGYTNTTGVGNAYFGNYAGFTYTGTHNTFIGDSADASSASLTNATAIGYDAKVGESNAIVLGSGANVGIGTSTPGNFLEIYSGTGGVSGLRMREMPTGSILFMNSSGDVSENNNNLYFDGTNYRLSVGAGQSPNSTITDGGSFASAISTQTASYTASVNDYTILCNAALTGSITITLPAVSGAKGRIYVIKNISTKGAATLQGNTGSDKIDGSTTFSLGTQYQYIMVQSDGSSWWILNHN